MMMSMWGGWAVVILLFIYGKSGCRQEGALGGPACGTQIYVASRRDRVEGWR